MPTLAGLDKYCYNVADVFALDEAANCTASDNEDVNLRFANGVTIQGLASDWIKPYADSPFSFKNIVIDADGEQGANKVGIDRFPLRVFKGGAFEGVLQALNCDEDRIYEREANVYYDLTTSSGKSPYCKDGFNANKTASTSDFLNDNTLVSYNIYRPIEVAEQARSALVVSGLAPLEADCIAHGGEGFFPARHCKSEGFEIHPKCINKRLCETCKGSGYNVCPDGVTKVEECNAIAISQNPLDVSCYVYIKKPTAGFGIVAGSIIGDIDI